MDRPKKDIRDVTYTVGQAVLSSLPVVGGPISTTLAQVFGPPVERRREKWLTYLGDVVEDLQHRTDDLEARDLSNNEMFISTVFRASAIALQTHNEEKLQMLSNAVRKSALQGSPREDLQFIYLRLIDDLTVSHVNLLKALVFPAQTKVYYQESPGGDGTGNEGRNTISHLEQTLPDFMNDMTFYVRLLKELRSYGLIDFPDTFTRRTPETQFEVLIPYASRFCLAEFTDLGTNFLSYIS